MKRKYILFMAALIAFVGSFIAAWATQQERDFRLRGYVDPTQNANLPYRLPRLGVNAELTRYEADELKQQLAWMQAAHIIWIRQIFRWDQIEPEQGQFIWDRWDSIIEAVDQYPDFRVVAVLMNTPAWARTALSPDNPTSPPNNPDDFAVFARAFAQRYGQFIDFYQVWDEPNLTENWGGLEPRAAEYAAILRAAYTAIHSADAYATVIAGGLAPTTETGPNNISDLVYLHDLYAYGVKDYMDAVAGKPHGFNISPNDRTVDSNVLNFSRIIALREEMVRNEDGKKALWASNWGWNSLPDSWTGRPSIWGSVSAEQQVEFTLAALDRAEREWPWLGGMILHHWQPDAPPDDPAWGFALIDQDNTPKTVWTALTQRPQPAGASNGLYHPLNPFTHYSGVWTFGQLGADIGWLETSDSRFEFNFSGQDAALLLRKDDYVAYLYPTVDGKPANAAPHDADGNAYVVLTSGSREPELSLVTVARGLSTSAHTLRVTADRGWDRWALAGLAVSNGDLAAPYNRQILTAWLTVSVAALSLIIVGREINRGTLFKPFTKLWQRLNEAGQLAISALTSLALMIGMLLTWGDAAPHIFRRDSVQLGVAVITAGIIYLEPGFVLTLLASIILFIILYHRLDFGLILTVFWAPFFLFPIELYRFAFPMAELTILLTGAAWLLHVLAQWGCSRQSKVSQFPSPALGQRIKHLTPMDWGVVGWVALGILSLLWAERRPQAITELRTLIIEPALFYTILRTLSPDRKTLIRLGDALLLAGLTVAVIGLFQYVRGEAIITAEGGARRLASVYGSPNNVGLYLGRCIPFALAYVLIKTNRLRRLFAGAVLIVTALAVALSQSVGALFIGIPAAVVAVVWLVWGKRAWRPLLILAIITAAVFAVALQSERFARVLDFTAGTNFFRIRVWQSSINILRDYPITGLGLDQFLYAFRGHYIMPDAQSEPNLSHPHNFILDFWVRLGILGVFLFVWMQVTFWRSSREIYRSYRDQGALFALTVGIMGSMANLITHGLVDNSVYVVDLAFIFVLLLGLSASLPNIRAIDEGDKKMV